MHLVAPRNKSVDDVRADEACTACHERPHGRDRTSPSLLGGALAVQFGGRARVELCPSSFRPCARLIVRAVFLTFEGIDGSGKSTQAQLLARALRADGREVATTREPGGTPLGERIRELLLNGQDMSPWAEAALFAAARAELVEQVIAPALESGKVVVCDRYVDSSLAYQGIARGLGVDEVLQLNEHATGGLFPDRTFLVLVDLATAAARARSPDRIEREGGEFQRKVDQAYRELATMFPDRIATVDGDRAADDVAEEIRGRIRQLS